MSRTEFIIKQVYNHSYSFCAPKTSKHFRLDYVSGLCQEAVQIIVNFNILLEQCDLENLGMYLWLQLKLSNQMCVRIACVQASSPHSQ